MRRLATILMWTWPAALAFAACGAMGSGSGSIRPRRRRPTRARPVRLRGRTDGWRRRDRPDRRQRVRSWRGDRDESGSGHAFTNEDSVPYTFTLDGREPRRRGQHRQRGVRGGPAHAAARLPLQYPLADDGHGHRQLERLQRWPRWRSRSTWRCRRRPSPPCAGLSPGRRHDEVCTGRAMEPTMLRVMIRMPSVWTSRAAPVISPPWRSTLVLARAPAEAGRRREWPRRGSCSPTSGIVSTEMRLPRRVAVLVRSPTAPSATRRPGALPSTMSDALAEDAYGPRWWMVRTSSRPGAPRDQRFLGRAALDSSRSRPAACPRWDDRGQVR